MLHIGNQQKNKNSFYVSRFKCKTFLHVRDYYIQKQQPKDVCILYAFLCILQVKEGDCIQPMSGVGYTTYPVVYRSHVYYMSSHTAREEFVNDPIKFLNQPTPKPVVPIKIAVVGPPKSGKTTRKFNLNDPK